MLSCKAVTMPLSSTTKLSVHAGEPLAPEDATKYHNLVGAMQYLTLTRLDISFSDNKVFQYPHAPTTDHLTAIKKSFVSCSILSTWVFISGSPLPPW
jgi:hypothetical protein